MAMFFPLTVRIIKKNQGASLLEYLFLLMLVLLVCIPSVGYFGFETNQKYETVVEAWQNWVIAGGEGPS